MALERSRFINSITFYSSLSFRHGLTITAGKDYFKEALDDYFDRILNLQSSPNEEDLEKMKITLNWLIKNRNKVTIFYLKEFMNKQELYTKHSIYNSRQASPPQESTFDIKVFLKDE